MEAQIKYWLKQIKENEATISMLLGGLVVIITGLILLNYYRQSQNRPQISETSEATSAAEISLNDDLQINDTEKLPESLPSSYKVVKGDYLWAIAEKFYRSGYNWVDIAKENKLENPDILVAGTQLNLPKVQVKTATNQPVVSKVKVNKVTPTNYTVAKNDSLWLIAQNVYNNGYKWVDIYQANKDKILDPGIIEIGWNLTIPKT